MLPLSLEELAQQADVEPGFLQRLLDLGALERRDGATPYGASDVRRVRLLRAWEAAGLSVDAIMGEVREGNLSISWLNTPVLNRAERLDGTYRELCLEEDVPLSLMQALQEALGLAPPDGADRVREGDRELLRLIKAFLAAGAEQGATLRLFRCTPACGEWSRQRRSSASPRSRGASGARGWVSGLFWSTAPGSARR
jgi:hypothetical protein